MPQRAENQPTLDPELGGRQIHRTLRRLDGLVERETAARVEHRRIPNLDVSDAFIVCVLQQLVGHALERGSALHDREGHVEAREVVLEMPRILDPHVMRQRFGGRCGHRHAEFAAKFKQRSGANRAVEVAMQLRLRKPPQLVARESACASR